jgi:hypothetical protein
MASSAPCGVRTRAATARPRAQLRRPAFSGPVCPSGLPSVPRAPPTATAGLRHGASTQRRSAEQEAPAVRCPVAPPRTAARPARGRCAFRRLCSLERYAGRPPSSPAGRSAATKQARPATKEPHAARGSAPAPATTPVVATPHAPAIAAAAWSPRVPAVRSAGRALRRRQGLATSAFVMTMTTAGGAPAYLSAGHRARYAPSPAVIHPAAARSRSAASSAPSPARPDRGAFEPASKRCPRRPTGRWARPAAATTAVAAESASPRGTARICAATIPTVATCHSFGVAWAQ